jgi:maltose alpha-D-glucosyltransferase/alpha-amylase
VATETLTLPTTVGAASHAIAGDDSTWYKDAIIYQVHVKSFFDSTNDGIGDFVGLTQKLDYLQSLGITCLWLLPFFPSPLRDDGYDIADYRSVHAGYGTLEDFKALVRAAHERNIRVLIELVVNHTSDQHPWFQRARHAPPGSRERAFYVWSDTDQKFPETRIIFCDTEKSNWTYDPVAKQYYWHRFFFHQPDLNHNNPEVVDAVIDVMKFWLDLGVDALRLDAVPYLCVREGTSNENLRETHDVLKRMRRELDASYPGRMLLAEANQWPADVRAYFGEGDECHMAFHFPLMPRMFMALRQEDRHAITEILSQTPEIPDSCQWALFLRNHDELTLEMVTDEERDYMYQAYAADPQMRLNLGIRRRLAPLVENSRRRVELLNSLLFSLPGTPIVYYGDEIGMGDNIYLGDRNGVRTPMQWSGDRNGGFSRADPARLYAPPIMDPVYGYQAINVEAQERSPFSLLNWMKRLITLRREHRVFGRGGLQFVGSSNRKVLAFLRRDDRETILVVANLSRSLQPVELDLRGLSGLIPVEMTGQTEFPRIADTSYFLTLGAYASYWFSLEQSPRHLTQTGSMTPPPDPNAALAEALPALMAGPNWEGILDSAARAVLEREALMPFLKRQRWFGSKSREIRQARFADWATIRGGGEPALLTVVAVAYGDGWHESYLVPLSFLSGERAGRWVKERPGCILAKLTGARKGAVIDGLLDDDLCSRLLDAIDQQRDFSMSKGRVRPLHMQPLELGTERQWHRPSGDQTNSIAFVDDRYALKLFRRLEPGDNPELEILRHLATRRMARVPALIGALLYDRSGFEPGTLALVETVVRHQGSAWDFTIEDLRRYYERVLARVHSGDFDQPSDPGHEPPPFFSALTSWYMTNATTLGRRTGELHVALRGGSDAFKPEPLDEQTRRETADAMQTYARDALRMLESRLGAVEPATRAKAEALIGAEPILLQRFEALRNIGSGPAGLRIRIHGDYHLGQVLRVEEDFVILDFEGEPARSLAERRAKHSPLKDVAGMIRSFSYAAYAALFSSSGLSADDRSLLEPWADTWQRWASQAFLNGYRATIQASPLVPDPPIFDALLRAFILEKALYELNYELNHRPEWVAIPLTGILKAV